MNHLDEIDKALLIGAKKAKNIASTVLKRTRKNLGY
jgi:tryptophanyl-tRNA synthetase